MDYREANILAQTFGFTLGTTLSGLLLFLIYRSGGKDRGARFCVAACVLIANGAGLFKNLALLGDPSLSPALEYRIRSIGFAAGSLCPYGILSIWRSNAVTSFRRRAGRWIVLYSLMSGSLIAISVIAGTWDAAQLSSIPGLSLLTAQDAVGNLAIYNGLLILIVGGIILLPGTLRGPTDQIAIALMILGLLVCTAGAAAGLFLHPPGATAHLAQIGRFQGVILLVVGVFFYFTHFRAADVFAKIALRLIMGGLLALAGALLLLGPIASATRNMPLPLATATLLAVAILGGTIFLYLRLGYWIDLLVERRVFGKRDPRQMIQDFRQQIGSQSSRASLIASIQSAAVETLAMRPEEIQVGPSSPDHTALPADVLIPIPSSNKPIRLAVSLQGDRRTLLTTEIDLLHEIALHAGKRLNDLEREEERIERVRTEGHLSRQLMEAELRALRSQINPHFLFNSLNTIASLIPSEPEKAEKMTIRLSSIFRYVLIQSGRPFSSLHEEMEFLRTLLEIEQIRFGERLAVTFEIDSAAEHLMIPSLILQPLVENAIKHGVTPKIGKSHILVGAQLQHDTVQIRIEDDGLGLRPDNGFDRRTRARMTNGTGIGLQNVRERLSTLYGEAAALTLTDLENFGCRATLTIPIHGVTDANSSAARGR
jgi:two-component system LytT family sensor kinase